jgi:hypothetical protein
MQAQKSFNKESGTPVKKSMPDRSTAARKNLGDIIYLVPGMSSRISLIEIIRLSIS